METIVLHIPTVEGESTLKGYEKKIQCMSFSHGVSMPLHMDPSGGGRSVARAQFQDFSMMKYLDQTSPKLNFYCATAKELGDVTIWLLQTEGGGTEVRMEYILNDAMLTSVSASTGGGLPMESITLNFTKISWTYNQQSKDAAKKGKFPATFDLMANVEK